MYPALTSAALLLCVFGGTHALYKQWLASTNFENGTNWDKGTVPCGSDRIRFMAQRKVSVFVETIHSVLEISLPVEGEFILPQGSGFTASNGQDSSCGPSTEVTFKDVETLQWFDPAMWQATSSWDDLAKGPFLFSVHEESVPCPHDDVVFRAASSFRVDTTGDQPSVTVRSLSVLGNKFSSSAEFEQYLGSRSGQLQFHGSSSIRVGDPGCSDSSGCVCDNSANRGKICAAVTCPSTNCKKPLQPAGHCCSVCGAIVYLHCTADFNLEVYRQRIQHLFLSQTPYRSIQLAVTKVSTPWLPGLMSRAAAAQVQVLLLDGETGTESGTVAESLAHDIIRDIRSQGAHLGIKEAEFQASSGSSSEGAQVSVGAAVGAVMVLILVAGLVLLVVLFRRGILKVPSLPSLSNFRKSSDIGELGGPLDHGFDNPIFAEFDKPTLMTAEPGLYARDTDVTHSIIMTNTGVHFVNPVYDETDFNA